MGRSLLRRRGALADAGTMSLELVLLTPLLVAFMMLMVGLGLVVEGQGQVEGAARDAARAASIGRTTVDADAAARAAAEATLSDRKQRCQGGAHTFVDFAQWRPGGQVTVTVRCHIDLGGLSLIGLAPAKTMTGTATAPIDTFRRLG
jgi:Flp pilus assembly protein TadG